MTALREFEGDSLDEALEAASAALGIPVDDLQYEMVEQGRRGVFGLGARQVRVRVELDMEQLVEPQPDPVPVRPTGPPKRERSEKRGRNEKRTRGERAAKPRRSKKPKKQTTS